VAKMTKTQLIDAIAEGTQVSKGDVKAVIEQMAVVGYKELNESGEFVIPGFVKMSVVNKPATEARSGINPFTKEPMEFAAKPASKSVKASPQRSPPACENIALIGLRAFSKNLELRF
jgi:DNA-binding protein HU-beta